MKKIIMVLATAAITAFATEKTKGQLALNLEATDTASTAQSANTVNLKAAKTFQKLHANAANVLWAPSADGGIIAHFETNGIKTEEAYTTKGKLNYTILRYNENMLPGNIKKQVTDAYEDYDISLVDELHINDAVVYLVHIEGKKSYKIIRIADGEMDVYKDYKKSI